MYIKLFEHDFPNLIKNGVVGSVIGQYISDLFFNVFVYNKREFLNIITEISPTPAYIAATASGFANGITEPYIDDLASAGLKNVVYVYTNLFFISKINETNIFDSLNAVNLLGDTMAVIILVWAFNIHAREDFYNHKARRNNLLPPYEDEMDIFTSIIIIFVINLYSYYKFSLRQGRNVVDNSVDIVD